MQLGLQVTVTRERRRKWVIFVSFLFTLWFL